MRNTSNSAHSIMNFILADCASSSEAEVEVIEGGSNCMAVGWPNTSTKGRLKAASVGERTDCERCRRIL